MFLFNCMVISKLWAVQVSDSPNKMKWNKFLLYEINGDVRTCKFSLTIVNKQKRSRLALELHLREFFSCASRYKRCIQIVISQNQNRNSLCYITFIFYSSSFTLTLLYITNKECIYTEYHNLFWLVHDLMVLIR